METCLFLLFLTCPGEAKNLIYLQKYHVHGKLLLRVRPLFHIICLVAFIQLSSGFGI